MGIWQFPPKYNPAYKNEALVARVKELWETNHSVRDMHSTLLDEGFEVEERSLTRIRQKNGWLLRQDPVHFKNKSVAAAEAYSPEGDLGDDGGVRGEMGDEEEASGTPDFGNDAAAALANIDFTQDQAEAFQEARKRALAAEAEEKKVTKKRRRWMKPRAGLPADPPGPPRFPSELSLTECKGVLQLDAATYKDVRAKFNRLCEEEGVVKKTIAGPHKWEAMKQQLIRESMHLRGLFWDGLDMDQRNLALDLICCDVTKNIRQAGSRMMLHEARNILGLNPTTGRWVRFHFQKILAEDHFGGKILAGEEHWHELVARWLHESPILQPIRPSMDSVYASDAMQKRKAIQVVARDAMKRYRDADVRGLLSLLLERDPDQQDDQRDAQGETDHEAGGDGGPADMTGFDNSAFGEDEAAQIAAQLSMGTTDNADQSSQLAIPADTQGPPAPPVPPKRKRGRPRKVPQPDPAQPDPAQPDPVRPDPVPEDGSSEPPVKKRRGRKSQRLPQEVAMAIYAHSQARFLPPDAAGGESSFASVEPEATSSFTSPAQQGTSNQQHYALTPAPASASVPVPASSSTQAQASTATPVQTDVQLQPEGQNLARARAQTQAQAQVQPPIQPQASAQAAPAAQRTTIATYFRLSPSSTVPGVPSMWIATLSSRSIEELRSKAVMRAPGARCVVIDGIVKDGMGGEVPLPIPGDTELGAYLDHMQEIHGPPTFSVVLAKG